MPWGLKRFQQARCLHFITFSCYHREPLLAAPQARDLFEVELERACAAGTGSMSADTWSCPSTW